MNDRQRTAFKEYFKRGLTVFLVVSACILFYFLLFRLDVVLYYLRKLVSILQPVIYGVVIAYLVNPFANLVVAGMRRLLARRIKNVRLCERICQLTGIFTSLILFMLIITVLIWLVVPEFIRSVTDVVSVLPSQVDKAVGFVSGLPRDNVQLEKLFVAVADYGKGWLENDLPTYVNRFASQFASGVMGLINFVKNFFVGLILAVYILLSKKTFLRQIKKLLNALFNRRKTELILRTGRKSNEIFSGFIFGKIIDSLIIGLLCFIGISILKIPYTMLVAVVIGVTNIIPVFGPYLGGIPCAALILLADPIKGIYFIVFVILLQTFDGNVLGPKILGESTGLSSFWVVVAIVLGGGFFGVAGMLLGVPVFAVLYYIISTLVNVRLARKHGAEENEILPCDTDDEDITDKNMQGG